MTIPTKIGDHLVIIRSKDPGIEETCRKLFSFSQTDVATPDLTINLVKGESIPFSSYEVKVDYSSNCHIYERDDFTIEVDKNYTEASITFHNELALKHSIMTLYSGLITQMNWGILLHSSCVLEGNTAHIFTGRSGAGKSTAAQLSAPRALLSDEASIIKIDSQQGVVVYHSPFRSELMDIAGEGPYSLKSLNLLHQSPDNHRMEMGKAQAFILLMDKVFYWSMNKEDVKKITSMLQQMITQTEVYHLYFKKDPTFWELMTS